MPTATITNAGLPIGEYVCSFEGVEQSTHPEFGDGWRWEFVVAEGPLTGKSTYRTTKTQPTLRNSCGRFLAALAGKKPSDGLNIDTDRFVGNLYKVVVTEIDPDRQSGVPRASSGAGYPPRVRGL